ncbi:MAG: trypsin-like peptidase domain-containing protein [Pseudomarimonas sp.]
MWQFPMIRLGWLLSATCMIVVAASPARASEPPPLAAASRITLPALDVSKALAEDIDEKRFGIARRFGLVAKLKGVTLASGEWTQLSDSSWLWRLQVNAPGAKALDFSFSQYHLPYGATLSIRELNNKRSIGPYSDRDNRVYGELYTPLLEGNSALLELRVPADRRELVRLQLAGVGRAYRGAFGDSAGTAASKSGSCNVDSICPQGDPWRAQIASVAHYSFQSDAGGMFVCTGQLTADASRSDNRLITTANHCISSDAEARSMVFYWGYENPTCRTPGSAASGTRIPLTGNFRATQSGATLLGSHGESDFTLVRLDDFVPSSAQAIATGWDRREIIPARTFSVHHPQGHEKRISFDDDPPALVNAPVSGITGTRYWHILAWNLGTTEGGSSGSGLWNTEGRLIGALSGGEANCSTNINDYYGRLSTAWEGGGSAATRVRDGLDPLGTGAQFADGGSASLGGVTLSSTAFANSPQAGQTVLFEATATGGVPPYTYRWDLDGDGEIDRSSTAARIEATFPRASSVQVSVQVSDSGGLSGMDSRSLAVVGPRLQAEAVGAATQVCGNNNALVDPGERWQQVVRLSNVGDIAQTPGHALFAAASGSLPIGPSSSGYTATTSAIGGCGFSWVDLVNGANAVPLLPTTVANGNAFGPLDDARTAVITLGGTGFNAFGTVRTQAVMSTNGYLSFDPQETGGDFSPTCTADFNAGAAGPQLRPYQDDLLVLGSGSTPATGAGLRYRYFDICPRSGEVGGAQGCHVFSWTRMQRYNGNQPTGDFDFQAIAYAGRGQIAYQYRTVSPDAGAAATIGIASATGSEVLNVSCQAGSPAPENSAACVFAPGGQPNNQSLVRLPAAVQAVAAIAIGQSTTLSVPFSVDAGAACGSSLAFDFVAAANATSHSVESRRVYDGTLASTCQPVTGCTVQGTPPSVRPGLYFNPQRSGNGVLNFVYPQTNGRAIFGGAWYTALRNRTPVWYALQGEIADGAGRVPIVRFSNSGAPSGFTPVPAAAGDAWVGQIDGTSMLLAWRLSNGDSGAERMEATPLPFGSPNHTQTWFNQAQSGWGLAIEGLNAGGPFEFIGAFIYDATGVARWAVGDIASFSGGNVPLIAHRPHCPACPWILDWTSDGRSAGSLQIGYGSRTSGTLSTTITLPAPYAGTWNRSALPIVPIAEPQP